MSTVHRESRYREKEKEKKRRREGRFEPALARSMLISGLTQETKWNLREIQTSGMGNSKELPIQKSGSKM
jgi:hypothetical protein